MFVAATSFRKWLCKAVSSYIMYSKINQHFWDKATQVSFVIIIFDDGVAQFITQYREQAKDKRVGIGMKQKEQSIDCFRNHTTAPCEEWEESDCSGVG